MESMDEMLARLTQESGGQIEERGQEFTLNPERVREALAGLMAHDKLLWVKHLFQWLYDLPQLRAPVLTEHASGFLLLNFFPEPEAEAKLTLARIARAETQLLAPGLANRLARVLVELGPNAQILDAREPGVALTSQKTGFQNAPSHAMLLEGVGVYFPLRSLSRTPLLFGYGKRQAMAELEALTGLHRLPPLLEKGPPVVADWPFPPTYTDDDDRMKLWDWESVEPSQSEDGFRWTVAAWSVLLERTEKPVHNIVRHPLEVRRAYSEHPFVGCYPDSIASKLDPQGPSQSHINIWARRVFGISWTASAPQNSLIIPVLRGVPGTPLPIEGAPPGFFLLADAGCLKTDASGVALVHDSEMEAWHDELLEWALSQTRLYLPYHEQIPTIWVQRSRRWRDAVRPPGLFGQMLKSALGATFSLPPVKKLVRRRHQAIVEWVEQRDSKLP